MALPRVMYGLHFLAGVAEYTDDRLFVSEDTMKRMNSSFAGKPIVVGHKKVDLNNVQKEADGYVVKSFFNKADGKCWAEFVVVSDDGHKAIADGWKLSNSYTVKKKGDAGRWNNIEYHVEVLEAEYDHLAIVENPRYAESIILTPEQFKEYNAKKENELMQMQNSITIQEKKMKFNIFGKKTVDNSDEIAKMSITLANGTERTIAELVEIVNGFDKAKEEEDKKKKENEAKEEEDKKKKKEDEEKENKKKNEDEEAEKLKKEAEKKNALPNKKDEILNAIENATAPEIMVVDTTANKVARGQRLYGSNK
jgi:hypothetical protein